MLVGALIKPAKRRPRSGSQRPRSAASASAARAIEHDDAREALEEFNGYCVVHRDGVTPAQRALIPAPPPVDEREVRKRLRRDATEALRWWRFGDRWAAHRTVTKEVLTAEVATEARCRDDERATAQAEADAAWDRLLANDAESVRKSVAEALSARDSAAALVMADGPRLEVRTVIPAVDAVVPLREPAYTPKGRPTARVLSKTNQNALYRQLVGSQLLALLRCILFAAPGVARIDLCAELPSRERLAQGSFERDAVVAIPINAQDPFADLLMVGLEIREKGRTHTLIPF